MIRVAHVSRPYWLAIPDTERDDLYGLVPEGMVVYIAPGHHAKPGTADVSLRQEVTRPDYPYPYWSVVRQVRGHLTARLVRSVLVGETVTTDAAGNVTSWTEGGA